MSAETMSRRCVALIPARGGSKRIPRKNLRDFAGKPLIAHSISIALDAGVFARVIVSTDDEEIATIAREAGAEVPFKRPAELSNDHATTDTVLLHALSWLAAHDKDPVTHLCCIYATAPLLEPEDLRRGIDVLEDHSASTALSITTFPFPIQRALRNQDQRLVLREPEHRLTRSQDLEEMYHDAGQFYWVDVANYLEHRKLYNDDMVGVNLPRHRVQDIDTLEDWTRAELLWKVLRREGE